MVEKHVKVPPGFELGSLDSESKVLTITPWNWLPGNLPTPLTHNNTQQHYITTLHNSTRVHKTTNLPVVYMALILNDFEGCNIITRGTPSNAPRNDVTPLKIITYCAIKTTGTLIVIYLFCNGVLSACDT
jgi:hypothetical protein